MADSLQTGGGGHLDEVSTRGSQRGPSVENNNPSASTSSNHPPVENIFSKLMKDSGLGSKSSAQIHQSESESAPKWGKPKESRDDRLDRLEQMVRQMTKNQGHYDYYYDKPDYDGAGYNGYYAPEGNTQNGYYASEGTTQNDAASREDMAPEKVTEGTIKDTPKSVQNGSVGFAAKYAS